MIGRAGQKPNQKAAAADDDDKDVEKDFPIKQGQEQTQDKEGNRVADKMPEIDVKKVGERNPHQPAGRARDNPIGIEPEREDEIHKIDSPDRADKISRNCSDTEFHGYSRGVFFGGESEQSERMIADRSLFRKRRENGKESQYPVANLRQAE